MGDFQGHPFRGNQYADVAAGDLRPGDKVVGGMHGGAQGTVRRVDSARAAGYKVIQFEEGHSTSLHKSAAVKVDRGEGPAKVHDPGKAEMEMERRAAQGLPPARAGSEGAPAWSGKPGDAGIDAQGRYVHFGAAAPDLGHLARENKIPADIRALPVHSSVETSKAISDLVQADFERKLADDRDRRAAVPHQPERVEAELALHKYRLANPRTAASGFKASPEERKLQDAVRQARRAQRAAWKPKDVEKWQREAAGPAFPANTGKFARRGGSEPKPSGIPKPRRSRG